ncbi:MAG: hypothetical protein U5L45_11300 [Saprospiraceae bacterium]|nr:hypothetical protein [Saprospiraceae bacterium]
MRLGGIVRNIRLGLSGHLCAMIRVSMDVSEINLSEATRTCPLASVFSIFCVGFISRIIVCPSNSCSKVCHVSLV